MLMPFLSLCAEKNKSKEQKEKQVRMINKYAACDGPSPQINVIVTMNAEEERGQRMAEMKV